MATGSNAEWIVPTRDARSLPVVEILTGRGFVSGKSGSGKSNTTGVLCEELLEAGYNFLVIDTEGEYYGLQEQYQLLHVGADEFADVRVGPEHAEKLAEIGLERNVPVILDVSGFDDVEESRELITRTVEELFRREKRVRKPFLLIVEEMQEYLPQQGGSDELAEILERVSKRGRKRGLGMCGISQRPSSVDKDFITQCDWMAWHRLTWEADVKVVSKIIGTERKEELTELDPGEAFLMTDWDDSIERVQFRRKQTHDAGATPGLESYDRPDLKTVGSELIDELDGDGDELDGPADQPSGGASSGSSGTSSGSGSASSSSNDAASASGGSSAESSGSTSASGGSNQPDAGGAGAAPDPDAGSLDELELPGDDADPAAGDPLAGGDGATGGDDATPGDLAAELEDEAAGAELERLRQQNRVLESEVEELRTLLQSIDPEHEEAADHDEQPAFAGPDAVSKAKREGAGAASGDAAAAADDASTEDTGSILDRIGRSGGGSDDAGEEPTPAPGGGAGAAGGRAGAASGGAGGADSGGGGLGGAATDGNGLGKPGLGGPSDGGSGTGPGTRGSRSPTRSAPTRPKPPEPPEDRDGVGGALLEFGELVIFLLQSVAFRVRLLGWGLREKL